jgi:putative restriction endonuclease
MPRADPRTLVDAVLDAARQSGRSAVLVSAPNRNPRRFSVAETDGRAISAWMYVWTLTHGGRDSLPDEYRIQLTAVPSPLPQNPAGATLLLGYEPNLKVFAGFDLEKHTSFTTGSPSVQVDIRRLRDALQDGLAFDRKGNDEIAVGFRPDHLGTYLHHAADLHRYGRDPTTLDLLAKASSLAAVAEADVDKLSTERRRVVQTVRRLSRLAAFRRQVLTAYDQRCAVTGIQLCLVDAAHILPVGAPGSADDVRNGIALAPTYHRAFDAGLIYLADDLAMRINREREAALAALALDGGINEFKAPLGKRVLLPADPRQRPEVTFIRRANRFRDAGIG